MLKSRKSRKEPQNSPQATLPDSIKNLLWEYKDIDWKKHLLTVIERVLDRGNADDVKWLFANVPRDKIAEVVAKSTNLDPKTANFWALKLNISQTACSQKRSPQKPNRLWKF